MPSPESSADASSDAGSGAPAATSPAGPRRVWRLARRALIAVLLVLTVLYFGRHRILGPIIIREVQQLAAADYGIQVHIGATGGSLLRDIELHDVAVDPMPELGLNRATVSRLGVQYSLLGLLLRSPTALRGVQLKGADLALDLDRIDLDVDTGGTLDVLPEVALENARLRVTLGQDWVELDGLSARLPAGALSESNTVSANVTAERTTLSVTAPLLPGTAADTAAPLDSGQPEARLLTLPTWDAGLQRRGDLLELLQITSEGRVVAERVALWLDAARDDRLELEVEAPLAASRAQIRYSTGSTTDHIVLDLQAADVQAMNQLAQDLGLPTERLPAEGQVDIDAALDVRWKPTLDVTGSLSIRARQLLADDEDAFGNAVLPALDRVSLDLALERGALTLTRGELEGPGGTIDLEGTRLHWLPGLALDLAATGRLAGDEFPADQPVVVDARVTLGDDGRVRVPELIASREDARLRLDDLEVFLGAQEAHASLAHLSFDSDIEDATADLQGIEVSWDGDTQALSAGLESARLSVLGQQSTLVAPARVSYSKGRLLSVESMRIEGAGGEVSLEGRLDTLESETDLQLVAHDLHPVGLLSTWFPKLPEHRLLERLEVRIRGAPDSLITSVSLSVLGISGLAPLPIDVQLQAEHQRDSLTIEHLQLSAADLIVATGSAELPLRDGWPDEQAGELHGELTFALEDVLGLLDEAPLRAIRLGGSATLAGAWPHPEVVIGIEGVGLQASGAELPPGARWPDLHAELRLAEDALTLDHLTLDGDLVQLEASGSCTALLQLDRDADGWPRLALNHEAPVQGRLDVAGTDNAWLVAALPGVRRAAGRVEAQLVLDGSLYHPHLEGPVSLEDGELALEGQGLASVTGLEGTARFDAPLDLDAVRRKGRNGGAPPASVVLRDIEFAGELGAAPFQLTGELSLAPPGDETLEQRLQVDLSLEGEELLLYRSGGLKVRGNTRIHIHGPWEGMTLSGEVAVTDGRMTRRLSLLDLGGNEAPISLQADRLAITTPPLSTMNLDVQLSTASPIRVSNRLLRSSLRLDAHVKGTGAAPLLSGNLIAERSRIELHLWTFSADRMAIQFDPRSLLRSELAGTARSRMLGYDVLAVLSGPLEEPEVRLSSLPPMDEEDLVNLVLTGQLPQEEGAFAEDSRVLSGLAIYLGKDLLNRAFGDESTENSEPFINRFEVETGRNHSRTGSETLDVRFRMMDDVFTEDDAIYLEVEQSEFDETNGSLRLVFRLK